MVGLMGICYIYKTAAEYVVAIKNKIKKNNSSYVHQVVSGKTTTWVNRNLKLAVLSVHQVPEDNKAE